jgi:hypothetical protein
MREKRIVYVVAHIPWLAPVRLLIKVGYVVKFASRERVELLVEGNCSNLDRSARYSVENREPELLYKFA